jgi:signal transduction histidine kinase
MFSGNDQEETLVDANEIVRDTIALLRSDLEGADVTVDLELSTGSLPVYCHRGQLQQIVSNIIINATDAMRAVGDRDRLLQVKSTIVETSWILISFEDSGTGIDTKNLERIFDPFFTTKPQGMGMGLAICKSIVEAHGGSLTVLQGISHGSVFQIALPFAQRAN